MVFWIYAQDRICLLYEDKQLFFAEVCRLDVNFLTYLACFP